MIIGDGDQCLSIEKKCYDSSSIMLKRKISDESSENSIGVSRIYLDDSTQLSQSQPSNVKMNFVDEHSSNSNRFSYQSKIDEIHQVGHQSYINLTTIAPTSTNHHVNGQPIVHENIYTESQSHHLHQHENEIKIPTSIAITSAKSNCISKGFQTNSAGEHVNLERFCSTSFN